MRREERIMPEKKTNALISIDFDGLSEPAKALIEKVSGAVGCLFEPTHKRRIAKANADVALIEAQSEIQITDLHRRAAQRWLNEEAQRQKNIEDITKQAIPHLAENTDASKVDNDWITNFFDKARIISDAEMQELWARVLAGEANSPGNYSKRTVNALGGIDKNDAALFIKLCSFCGILGGITPLILDLNDKIYSENSLTFLNLTHLDSIGLINFNDITGFRRIGLPKIISIQYYGKPLYLTMPKDSDNELDIGKVILTKIGKELVPTCVSQPVDGFIEYIRNKWSAFSPSDSI